MKKGAAPASVFRSLQASGFAVVVLVLLVAGVVVLSPTLSILAEQQQEIATLEVALEQSQQEVVTLEEQRGAMERPGHLSKPKLESVCFCLSRRYHLSRDRRCR